MHKVWPTHSRAVHAGDNEGRRGNATFNLHALGDALRQRRLSSPQRPIQDHYIAGFKRCTQFFPECVGFFHRG